MKRLLQILKDVEGGLVVIGIACVPELVRGIRLCDKLDIEVVGIPLNANRCARQMGRFPPAPAEHGEVRTLLG